MPFKKGYKRYKKRYFVPGAVIRPTGIKKRAGIGKSLMYNSSKVPHLVKRTANIGNFIADALLETNRAFSFSLAQVPGNAELTSLFDSYRIDKVVVSLRPFKASEQEVQSSAYNTPRVYHVIDYDDDTVVSIAALQEYANCKTTTARYTIKRTFVPKIAQTVYRTAATSAYATPEKAIKLDCAYADVPHYGFKVGMTNSGTANAYGYEVIVDYYMSFFGIR